jgi:hypothetical protein
MEELKKVIRDRIFDASNESETTIENIDVSFNKDDN